MSGSHTTAVLPSGPPSAPLPVSEMPERYLIDLAAKCNLRCPMCPVWGSDDEAAIASVKGVMDLEASRRLLDEMASAKAMLQPNMYGEPLLAPDLRAQLLAMKERGLAVAMNTNGLTLTDELAGFLVGIGLDSVFFSIDATTPETLLKIRGIDRLEKIEAAVLRLLNARGDAEHPRIGVSFTVQDDNLHERDAFVRRWVGVVDCVRVGLVFENGSFKDMPDPGPRRPCPALYKTMAIHNDGHVTACCLDGFRRTDLGNVFRDGGIKAVWHGEKFRQFRHWHETGQWDRVPFCKPCNGWAQYDFTEEVADGLLIRRSPELTYYNSISRLRNWHGALLGGHPAPDAIAAAG